MKHVKTTSKTRRPMHANDIEDFVNKIACEIDPGKGKCGSEKK